MKVEQVSFETVARIHMMAAPDRQQEGLRAWLAVLVPGFTQEETDEQLLSLKEIGRAVRKDPTWLWKLRVREHCGIRVAGSYRYKKSEVMDYLQSDECLARISELHRIRKAREAAKRKART